MAVTASNRTVANASTEGNLKKDVSDILWHIGEPTAYPLHTLLGGKLYKKGVEKPEDVAGKVKKEKAIQPKYSVIEKDPLSRTVTVNGAVADTTTTTITLDSNTNCRVGVTMRNVESGEVVYVTAVDSGGADVTARRNLGSTSYTIADNSTFKIMGYASAEGQAKAALKSQLAAERERRLQIYKWTFGVTGTLLESLLYTQDGGSDAWDEEMTQAAVNHRLDIENSWWFNSAADSTTDTSSNTVNLSRGIIAEIGSTRETDAGGALDEDLFFGAFAAAAFEFGPRRKGLFVDAELMSRINSWPRVKQQTAPFGTKYGFKVQEVETGHGIFDIMPNGSFGSFLSAAESGYGVVLDLERVVYKYLENRDSKYEVDVQTPGTDAREGQYITECGLSLRSLDHHRILKNI